MRETWQFVTDKLTDPETTLPSRAAQGGVFDPAGGILYLTSSGDQAYHGIVAVNPDDGVMLTKTGDNFGPFNFQREWPGFQEEEGIDYFDMTGRPELPGGGELHALLNFNSEAGIGDAAVSLKRYTAWPEKYCKATPGDNEVTIWSNGNFQGICRTLPVGNYPNYHWMFPMRNNWTSSILTGAKVQATLYGDDNYGYPEWVFRGNQLYSCLPDDCNWNDKLSSMRVACLPSYPLCRL